MAKPLVYAAGGDIGGMKEVHEGMKVLRDAGVDVMYFVDDDPRAKAGTDFLAKQSPVIPYETRGPVDSDCPNIIVIGTSATAWAGQIAWTLYGESRRIPVIWVEDFYGTGERQGTLEVLPTVMLVIDAVAAEIVRKVRPGLKTIIVGKPTFGTLPNKDQAVVIREHIRRELGVRDHEFLLTIGFSGDPAERAVVQLPLIINALQGFDVVCAFRFHPKHPQKDALWSVVKASELHCVDARTYDLTDLNIASDAVFVDWGNTDAIKAILYSVPTMTMLFPEKFVTESGQVFHDYERRASVGYPEGVPPIIASHPGWGMRNPIDFSVCLRDVMEYPDYAQKATAQRAESFYDLLIPGAAERIAGEVMSFLF